jgi:hypothetical protein
VIRKNKPYGIVDSSIWFGEDTLDKLLQKAPIE